MGTEKMQPFGWRLACGLGLILALVWAAFGEGAVSAQEAPEAEKATVVEIQIEGNEHVSPSEIKAALPFKEGDEIVLDDDLIRAEGALSKLGLFQEVSWDYRRTEGGVVVIFTVIENPVIEEIEIRGNRDWNEGRRLEIPWVGLSFPWPFVDYLVTPERLREILKRHGIEPGKLLNTVELQKALGVSDLKSGQCAQNPPKPSFCREYQDKGYFLFAIDTEHLQLGEKLVIPVIEGVIESVDLEGVEGPVKEEALKILKELPLLRPVKRQKLQEVLQKVSQSVYLEPLSPEDVGLLPGSAPDRVVLKLKLKERRLLEKPVAVQQLRFVGQSVFSEEELLKRTELPEKAQIDNYELLKALRGVYRLYRKEGYFLMKLKLEDLSEGVLTLRVEEGRIAEIEIHQNGYTTARLTEEGLEKIPLEGDTEPASPSKSAARQENLLLEVLARLSSLLGAILGTSATEGLPRTRPEIIAKELTIQPGGLVNRFRLAESFRRLLSLGYFSDVNFDFEPLGEGEVRLIVEVTEKEKLGSLNGGFSISSEGLVGQLSLSGKNLYGTGQDLSLKFDRGITGKAQTNWSLDYQSRLLIPQADYLSVKLFNRASKEKSPRPHLLKRLGAEASVAFPWEGVQGVVGLRAESFTKDFEEGEGPRIEHGFLTVLSLTVTQDDRNNPIFATRGGIRSVEVEKAGLLGLGEPFTKLQTTLVQHFPTFEDQTIAIRLMGGVGIDLPSQEEFLLGGSTTLRGIAPFRTPAMALLNVEYRVQLLPNTFSAALFADLGSGESFELKKSIGVEWRLSVPYLGLVRIAFVWPITDHLEALRAEFGFGPFF